MRTRPLVGTAIAASLLLALTACDAGDDSGRGSGDELGEDVTPSAGVGQDQGAGTSIEIDDLTGVESRLTLAADFAEALGALDVSFAPIGSAEISSTLLRFPISGGDLDVSADTIDGEIEHDGSGVALSAGAATVELTDLDIDLGEATVLGTVTLNGEPAGDDVDLFDLDTGDVEVTDGLDGTVTVDAMGATVAPEAAQLLEQAFGAEGLSGAEVGAATIIAAPVD